jgi:uncharacterized membrane protein
MVVNYRTRTILCGSAVNCVTAILLVSLFLTTWSVVTSRNLREFAMFPWLVWAVTIFAGPFAVFTGLIGMALLTRARREQPSRGRYLAESVGTGTLLGGLYPLTAALFRLEGLVTWAYLALGLVSGTLCGLVIGLLSIPRVLRGSAH